MDSSIVASKALVQVCLQPQDGATLYRCLMDVNYDKDTFNCKFRTRVQLVGSTKKAFVHLFLDATHVKSLEICDNDEAVPPVTENALMGRGLSMSSDSVTTLRFALKSVASLVVPDLALHKNSSCEELETLLRIGKCKTFSVHVSSSAINKERLSSLCSALAENSLQPAAEGVLSNLYVNSSYKKVDQVDQIWSSKPVGSSIPHETSTASEASNNEAAGPSGLTPSSSSGGHGKRRSVSPDSLQNPSKRQALTEDAAENPLKIIYAFQEAQKAELASLKKDLVALRGQVQQLQRAPGVDAGTQTDPIVEHRSELFPETDPSHVIHTPARTVENTMDNRFTMFEQNIDAKIRVKFGKICRRLDDRLLDNEMDITDEGILRERLDQRLVQRLESNEEQLLGVEMFQYLEYDRLESNIDALATRVTSLNNNLGNDLRRNFNEAIEKQKLDLQAEMKEVVKQDVREALENGKVKFEFDFGSAETGSQSRS